MYCVLRFLFYLLICTFKQITVAEEKPFTSTRGPASLQGFVFRCISLLLEIVQVVQFLLHTCIMTNRSKSIGLSVLYIVELITDAI